MESFDFYDDPVELQREIAETSDVLEAIKIVLHEHS